MDVSLQAFLFRGASLDEMSAAADALDPAQRRAAIRALSAGELRLLWQLAETNAPPASLDLLLPTGRGASLWAGRNSLPVFPNFSKAFARVDGLLVGRNLTSLNRMAGPGYFVVSAPPDSTHELLFDYGALPPRPPEGWPPIRPNDRGVSRLVFGGMRDRLRFVGKHLAIGAAFSRKGKFRGVYFVLARET